MPQERFKGTQTLQPGRLVKALAEAKDLGKMNVLFYQTHKTMWSEQRKQKATFVEQNAYEFP